MKRGEVRKRKKEKEWKIKMSLEGEEQHWKGE